MPFLETAAAVGGITAGVGGLAQLGDAIFGSDEPSDWQKEQYGQALLRQEEYARQNKAMQYEFAKNGIQWRVEDARKAGINPIVALGGGGATASPITVGDPGIPGPSHKPGIGDALSNMGQNISRAVKATQMISDRQQLEQNELQLENLKLQNALLGQRLTAGSNQPSQIGPALPEERPIHPDIAYVKTKGGGLAPAPSEQFADRAEDQWLPQIAWAIRNLALPVTPDRDPGKGKMWSWDPTKFEFERIEDPRQVYGPPQGQVLWRRLYDHLRNLYNKK